MSVDTDKIARHCADKLLDRIVVVEDLIDRGIGDQKKLRAELTSLETRFNLACRLHETGGLGLHY